jgi:pimeloyl-ACP methyl ester carboxylesterase
MTADLTHRVVATNGIHMQIAEQGEGPLVVLCHGWPELGRSWRHQLAPLAAARYRAVAPDMRGYGQTDAPADIAAYTLMHLVGDIVGLVAALGEKEAIIVGHDWGAIVAWAAAMMRPDLFRTVAIMSVPRPVRGPDAPLKLLRAAGANSFYWIYFQEPGVAEAEFERDIPGTFRKLIAGALSDPTGKRRSPLILAPGGGFLDGVVAPASLPAWFTEADLAAVVAEYTRTGFRGGLNWYRNIDRNWELTAPWEGTLIHQPTLFIAGTRDPVIAGPMGEAALRQMPQIVPGLKRQVLVDGAGHWIQQERPTEVNAALIGFLREFAPASR